MIQYLKFMLIVMQIIVMMKSRSLKCQSFIVIRELCSVTSVFRTRINKDFVCKNRALRVTLHFGDLDDQYLAGSSILCRNDAVFLRAQIEPYHLDSVFLT